MLANDQDKPEFYDTEWTKDDYNFCNFLFEVLIKKKIFCFPDTRKHVFSKQLCLCKQY